MEAIETNKGLATCVDGESIRAVAQACSLEEHALPAQVLIAPWGEVASANGSFIVDEEGAAAVLEAFVQQGTDLPIDYEHQSLGGTYASPDGLAPAAGWIRALKAVSPGREDESFPAPGLWAKVEWTEAAGERLAAREYRYLSPVVLVRRLDRRVISLHSAALTNKPAICGMQPIINRKSVEEDVVASIPETQPRRVEVTFADAASSPEIELKALRARLNLGGEASLTAVLAAAHERIGQLDEAVRQREAAGRVEEACRAGKLGAGLQAWALRLALQDPACFDEWVAAAPVLVTAGRTAPPANERTGSNQVAIAASARHAFRAEPALALLTTEDAFVADALRQAALSTEK